MKKPIFVNDGIYHVILRGVGDIEIFKDVSDYYRGIFSIYEFNNKNSVEIRIQREKRKTIKKHGSPTSDNRERFVDVLAFCFMPNHIHLLIKQIRNNGITDFMRKVGTGYANYFNKKYNRRGHLFQGNFHAVEIKDDSQLSIVFAYIHTNPISLVELKWKENGINNIENVIKFLKKYKWSSYLDYIGGRSFPSVTNRELIMEILGGEAGCIDFINNIWMKHKSRN